MQFMVRLEIFGKEYYYGDQQSVMSIDGNTVYVHGQLSAIEVDFVLDIFKASPEQLSLELKLTLPIDAIDYHNRGYSLSDGMGELYYLPDGTWANRQLVIASPLVNPGVTDDNILGFNLETVRPDDEGNISIYTISEERWPNLPSTTAEGTEVPYVFGRPGNGTRPIGTGSGENGAAYVYPGTKAHLVSTTNTYFTQSPESIWAGVFEDGVDANNFRNYYAYDPETEAETAHPLNYLLFPSKKYLKPNTVSFTWVDQSDGSTQSAHDDGAGGWIPDGAASVSGEIDYTTGNITLVFALPHWPEEGTNILIEYDYGAVPLVIAANKCTNGYVSLYKTVGETETITQNVQTFDAYDSLGTWVTVCFVDAPDPLLDTPVYHVSWTTAEGVAGNAADTILFLMRYSQEGFDVNRSQAALDYLRKVSVGFYLDSEVSPLDWFQSLSAIAPVSFTSGPNGMYVHVVPFEIAGTLLPEVHLIDGDNAYLMDDEVFEAKRGAPIKLRWAYRATDQELKWSTASDSTPGLVLSSVDSNLITDFREAKKATLAHNYMSSPGSETVWTVNRAVNKGATVALTCEVMGWRERLGVVVESFVGDLLRVKVRFLTKGERRVSRSSILWGEPTGELWGDDNGVWGEI